MSTADQYTMWFMKSLNIYQWGNNCKQIQGVGIPSQRFSLGLLPRPSVSFFLGIVSDISNFWDLACGFLPCFTLHGRMALFKGVTQAEADRNF